MESFFLIASQICVIAMAITQITVARKMWPFMTMQHRQSIDDARERQNQEAKKQEEDKLRKSVIRVQDALVHDQLPEDLRRDLHALFPVLRSRPEDDHDS